MGRRKRGQPIHGWLIIHKPAGMGSTDVVNQLRKTYDAQKAGHGGTLDPDATGVLPIAFGEATKLLPFLEDLLKTYEFEANWGARTNTDDASGEIIARSNSKAPTTKLILEILPKFQGQIHQTPPLVSAVKIDGKRAYDLAREGEEFELKSRPLFVQELTLLKTMSQSAHFRMKCSLGGYVRSMARDLGEELGVLGHVAWLRRNSTLGFDEEDAIDFETAITTLPPLRSITDTPALNQMEVSYDDACEIGYGRTLQNLAGDGVFLACFENTPLAVIEISNGQGIVLRGLNVDASKVL